MLSGWSKFKSAIASGISGGLLRPEMKTNLVLLIILVPFVLKVNLQHNFFANIDSTLFALGVGFRRATSVPAVGIRTSRELKFTAISADGDIWWDQSPS